MTSLPTRTLLWTYGFVLFTFLGASAALTPLYPLYRTQWHASLPMVQAAFAIYAVTLLCAFLCFGALSDHVGRRRVVLIALAIEMLAMLRFATAQDITAVLAGRALQGLATGTATSALSAALQDADRKWGALLAGMVPMASMGTMALASALLARFSLSPLHLIFVLLGGTFALAVPAILGLPETASPRPGALASLKPRVHVPPQARSALLTTAPANISVWALAGLLLSLGPAIAQTANGNRPDLLLGGWESAAVMGTAFLAIVLHLNQSPDVFLRRGTTSVLLGLPIALLGLHSHALSVFFLGSAIAGAGLGLVVQGSLRLILPLAHTHERAGLAACYFVLSYLAFCVPAFAAGLAVSHLGLTLTTDLYAMLLMALTGLTLLTLSRQKAGRCTP